MQELCQLYDELGHPLPNHGATKNDIYARGLLHGAAHVWIWRINDKTPEILLQKRAASSRTWPD